MVKKRKVASFAVISSMYSVCVLLDLCFAICSLQAGEDFSELAREFSDDPGSGASGGDLGWVNPGDMVPAFDKTMAVTEPGQMSTPFESRFGWHILLVEDRKQTDIGIEKQRDQVRQMLYGRRFEEELPIWLRKVRSEAYVDIKAPQ